MNSADANSQPTIFILLTEISQFDVMISPVVPQVVFLP
jgi:hypothetical protein